MGFRDRKAFTWIELIMTMAVIVILSVGGAYALTFMVHSAVFIPSQLNADMLASEALDTMIEGDAQAKGLRFSRTVTDVKPQEVTFTNQDGQNIRYWLNVADDRLYRSIDGSSGGTMPYYAGSAGVSFAAPSGQVFSYFDGAGAVTANPADVHRIDIAVEAATGTGAFEDGAGYRSLNSAVAVNRY